MKSLAAAIAAGIAAHFLAESIRYCLNVLKWLPRHEQWARASQGCCPACGYNLTANVSGTCPECGQKIGSIPIDPNAVTAPSLITERHPWWMWTITLATMILAVIAQRLLWP